jgi:hypothetical protein
VKSVLWGTTPLGRLPLPETWEYYNPSVKFVNKSPKAHRIHIETLSNLFRCIIKNFLQKNTEDLHRVHQEKYKTSGILRVLCVFFALSGVKFLLFYSFTYSVEG